MVCEVGDNFREIPPREEDVCPSIVHERIIGDSFSSCGCGEK